MGLTLQWEKACAIVETIRGALYALRTDPVPRLT